MKKKTAIEDMELKDAINSRNFHIKKTPPIKMRALLKKGKYKELYNSMLDACVKHNPEMKLIDARNDIETMLRLMTDTECLLWNEEIKNDKYYAERISAFNSSQKKFAFLPVWTR